MIGCACGWFCLSGNEFITAPGIAVNKGISDDGKSLILRSVPGATESSFLWTPPADPVEIADLPGGATRVRALAIAGNGKTVVGWSSSINGDSEAFRWTMEGGTVALGDLPTGYFQSEATGCNTTGDFVFGTGNIMHNSMRRTQAVVWGIDNVIAGLGFLPGGYDATTPFDCAEDGTVVVGSGFTADGAETFVWNNIDGLQNLGLIPNQDEVPTYENSPLACSDSGDSIIGFGYSDLWGYTHGPVSIWNWSASAGFQILAEAPGEADFNGPPHFRPNALVSQDLRTVVAEYTSKDGDGILRWRQDIGVDNLEFIGKSMSAWDISADGQVVVGTMTGLDDIARAVLWGPDGNIKILKDFLNETGTDTGDTELSSATAVSADGRTFAGSVGTNPLDPPVAFHAMISGVWIFDTIIDEFWRNSDWYGLYATTTADFIYHNEHGFQLIVPDNPGAFFVYDTGLDCWCWTSQQVYPFFYKYGYMEGWIYYYLGSTPAQRWFFAMDGNGLVSENELIEPQP